MTVRIGRTAAVWPALVYDMRITHDPKKRYGRGVRSRHTLLTNGQVWAMTKPFCGFIVTWLTDEKPWTPWPPRVKK